MRFFELSRVVVCCAGIYAFLFSGFELLSISRCLISRSKRLFLIPYFIMLTLGVILMQSVSALCRYWERGVEASAFTTMLWHTPAVYVFAVLLALTAGGSVLWVVFDRAVHAELTPMSIQEGLDSLPDGVSFSTPDGIPLFVNSKMQSISSAATGTGVINARELRVKLERGELLPDCASEQRGDNIFLSLPEGGVWNISYKDTAVEDVRVCECVAYDVTELYEKNRELEMRNEHLAQVNRKIREYSLRLDSIVRDNEILNAKIRIHDDVGRCLLALRSYLAKRGGDREALVNMWRFTASVLKGEAASQDTSDMLQTLTQAAEAVDVTIDIDGVIPGEPDIEAVAIMAIHECLTNTVKHAGGDVLSVHIEDRDGAVVMELTNNGVQPKETVKETGGLGTLRSAVEKRGGAMRIESLPGFLLHIEMRRGHHTDE